MHQSDVECRNSQLLIHHGHDYHQYLPLSDVIIAFHHGIIPLDPGAQWLQLLQLLDLLSSDLTSAMLAKNDGKILHGMSMWGICVCLWVYKRC